MKDIAFVSSCEDGRETGEAGNKWKVSIPEGTEIVLVKKNGETTRYTNDTIGEMKQSLLPFAANLSIFKKIMTTSPADKSI